MARNGKPKRATVEETDDDKEQERGQLGGDEQDEVPADSDIDSLLAEEDAPHEVRITVYRITGPQRRKAYLFSCDAVEFSRDKLRDDHGGGDFFVYAKRGRDLLFSKPILIEPPRVAPSAPPVQAPALADVVAQALAGLKEVMTAAIAQPKPVETEEDFLRKMTLYKSLFASSAQQAPTQPGDSFSIFRQGIEFAKELTSEGKEKTNLDVINNAIEKLGPPLVAIATRQARREPVAQPRAAAPINNAPATLPAGAQAVETPMDEALRTYGPWIVAQAEAGADPGIYADLILDQVDPMSLRAFLSQEPWSKLVAIVPRAADHRAWFDDLLSQVTSGLNEDVSGDDAIGNDSSVVQHP